ncbi:hypothetical protein [Burkholderia seminalis]|uniref:hypothetical protein n=1 Tax=Burkholderia seminalis TaxID=488731 RepID=UPI0009F34A67|nr:hypothetical protein [Burkholderia seminalis]MBJ9589370.1 hypothetical protein [Burkholderia seminalis]
MPLIGSHILTPFINRLTIAAHVRVRAKRIESGQPEAARFAMPMLGNDKASHDGAYLASSYFWSRQLSYRHQIRQTDFGADGDTAQSHKRSMQVNHLHIAHAQQGVRSSTHGPIFILEANRLNPQYSRAPSFQA